ncbi:hypothetical protein METBIDRAFT_37387 [Metschnikowia bicuspidata var. bicuspidata NRRL YB-4993]|uniref:Uncharacterized protein n=1 Tax=Metschnikowia bicuspidata var. bicuspidata NRRL YB-4993 TaxID=869754 RepID=A0A1A0HFX9_9ASCO|nr:hypothetical protein METBIDRAFT_37387 [Metschnikowia bicuspidata var. bicuspidata NRRL YB-4993]OBA23064.1 hypothetical protein METBIDRAFT_37387 [Metschnikowia bicuspidata var. bicuspidata NRRL YB-4993]
MSESFFDEAKPSFSHDSVSRIRTEGHGDEIVVLGNKRYYKHELMRAFGGTLQSERLAPFKEPKFGNAAALGLTAFATSAFVLGLSLAGAKGITVPNITVGLCFFYGGVVQAAAGIWELFLGNTFAGTVLCSFGMGFWMSFGAMNVEAFGIVAAYGTDTEMLSNAIGLYLVGWGIFTFLMLLCTLKTTLAFMGLFFTLDIGFFVLAGYYFTAEPKLLTTGGVFVTMAALCGWYCAFAGVATPENSYIVPFSFMLPVFGESKAKK